MEPSPKHLEVLKKYFGHKEFRPLQWKIINSIIKDRRDNCVVMATGYGKSLCFQYPPVYCQGMALVISPLISLMQDQVLALKMCNIPATFLGSAQASKDAIYRMKNGDYSVVYVTPEWCNGEYGKMILEELGESGVRITLIAIDEAHCVSEWGMDFRSSYRKLGNLRKYLPKVPLLTVTATATESVRADICTSLKLRNPLITCTSCDRPNFYISASIKGKDPLSDIRDFLFKTTLKNAANCSSIIYCPTKKIASAVAEALNGADIKCGLYHADLKLSVREKVHKEFVTDEISIIVATVAFGMGIDKPDVRYIIHYGAPKDIEMYYQEIGRAGRDGLPAYCHAFYTQADFQLSKHFFSHLTGKFREHKEKMGKLMENYLQTSDCRRKMIVSHFNPGEKLEKSDSCCDNCTRKKFSKPQEELDYDLSEDAVLLLKAVHEFEGRYGLAMAIFLLRGSTNKRLPTVYYSSELYRAGYHRSDYFWRLLGGLLIREDLIEEKFLNIGGGWNKNNFPVKTLSLTSKGKQYLLDKHWRELIVLKPTQEMVPLIKKILPRTAITNNPDGWISSVSSPTSESEVDGTALRETVLEELIFEDLITFRSKVANELGCMPYMIFNNRTMQYLSQKRPSTIEELSLVEGITEKIVEAYGQACVDCIAASYEKYKSKSFRPGTMKKDLKCFVHNSKQRILRYEKPGSKDKNSLTQSMKDDGETDSQTFDNIPTLRQSETDSEYATALEDNDFSQSDLDSTIEKSSGNKWNSNSVCPETSENLLTEADDDFFSSINESELISKQSEFEQRMVNTELDDSQNQTEESFMPPMKRSRFTQVKNESNLNTSNLDLVSKKVTSTKIGSFDKSDEKKLIANNEKKKTIIKKLIKL